MRFPALSAVACLALALAVSLSASAQELDDPTRSRLAETGGTGLYPSPTLHGKLELALADAIGMGLENNLQVEIVRHEPLIRHADHKIAWGAYDPEFYAEFGWAEIDDPTANVLAGSGGEPVSLVQTETMDGFGGFRGLIPWLGASYDLQLEGSRNSTNVSIQALSPELESAVNFSFTVPLMRGLIWNEPWTLVKTTRVREESALEEFRRDIMDTVQAIENAYWALVADEERVRVAEKSLETADALLEQVQTQYEVGVVSKVEIAEAEAGVAARDFDLIRQQAIYGNTMDVLIDLVLGPNLAADSRVVIDPTDRPDDFVPYDIDVEQATQIAFKHRPELVIAEKEIERLELNLKLAKNRRLPRFDAIVSYGNRGLAGDQNDDFDPCRFSSDPVGCAADPPPPIDLGGWTDTFTNPPGNFFTSDAASQLTARAVVSIDIPNTAPRNRVSKAQLELRRARVSRRRVEQDIVLQVRRAVRDLKAAQEGIEAAERREVAAQEQLRAERIRLEYGESTPFDVLLRESDLVDAEAEKIGAFQVYRDSVTNLDRFQGTILRNRNVRIDQVARLR